MGDIRLYFKPWWIGQPVFAAQLPPSIAPEPRTVRRVGRIGGLPLMPIAQVMRPDHPERACHADQTAQPDQKPQHPLRGVEAAMNQLAVHPDRMACAKHNRRQSEKGQRPRP